MTDLIGGIHVAYVLNTSIRISWCPTCLTYIIIRYLLSQKLLTGSEHVVGPGIARMLTHQNCENVKMQNVRLVFQRANHWADLLYFSIQYNYILHNLQHSIVRLNVWKTLHHMWYRWNIYLCFTRNLNHIHWNDHFITSRTLLEHFALAFVLLMRDETELL